MPRLKRQAAEKPEGRLTGVIASPTEENRKLSKRLSPEEGENSMDELIRTQVETCEQSSSCERHPSSAEERWLTDNQEISRNWRGYDPEILSALEF